MQTRLYKAFIGNMANRKKAATDVYSETLRYYFPLYTKYDKDEMGLSKTTKTSSSHIHFNSLKLDNVKNYTDLESTESSFHTWRSRSQERNSTASQIETEMSRYISVFRNGESIKTMNKHVWCTHPILKLSLKGGMDVEGMAFDDIDVRFQNSR